MNAEQCIKERRSVRKFSDEPLTQGVLGEIAELARYAPSWKNTQVARYHIVQTAELKERIASECVCGFEFNIKTINRCNALVVLSVKKGISGCEQPEGSTETQQEPYWEIFDAGIAAQTFCLAAHAKGVGSVILGIFDADAITKMLEIDESERVVALVALGYPLSAPKAAPPRKDVAEIVSYR